MDKPYLRIGASQFEVDFDPRKEMVYAERGKIFILEEWFINIY